MKSKVYWVKASRREAPAALSEKAEALYLKLGSTRRSTRNLLSP